MSDRQPRKNAQKVLFSIAALAAAAGLAGVGTYANFTGSTSASQTVTSGTMTIALGTPNTSNNRLAVNAAGFAPGDTMQRAVTLTVGGDVDLLSVNLTTTDTTATPTILTNDPTNNGLKINIERCSAAWTETAIGAPVNAYTYTCSATMTNVLGTPAAPVPVVGAARALNNLAITAPSTNFLRVTISLPTAADDTFQNTVASPKSATISEVFAGVQRVATDK